MRLGKKLAVGVVEEGERTTESVVMRDDVSAPPPDEAEVSTPSEERPCRERFVGSAVED